MFTDSEQKEQTKEDLDLTCSVCLEILSQPRSLPCSHSFCEDCLTGYIEKFIGKSSFPCPLCRVESETKSSISDPEKWAKSFPLNYTLLSILKKKSNSTQKLEMLCGLCLGENVEIPATVYCVDCNEKICEQCKQVHTKIKSINSHRICELNDAPSTGTTHLLQKLITCPNHNSESVVYLCQDHDVLCCSQCAVSRHRKCDSLDSLGDIVPETIEETDNENSIVKKLDELEQCAIKKIEKADKSIKKVEDSEKSIQKQLCDVKVKLDDAFKQLEERVSQEVGDKKQQLLTTIMLQKDALESVKSDISKTKENTKMVQMHGKNIHVYLMERMMKAETLHKLKPTLDGIRVDENYGQFHALESTPIEEIVNLLVNCVKVDPETREIRYESSSESSKDTVLITEDGELSQYEQSIDMAQSKSNMKYDACDLSTQDEDMPSSLYKVKQKRKKRR